LFRLNLHNQFTHKHFWLPVNKSQVIQYCFSNKLVLNTWRAICTKQIKRVHRNVLIYDYLWFLLHTFEFQNVIRKKIFIKSLQITLLIFFVIFLVMHSMPNT